MHIAGQWFLQAICMISTKARNDIFNCWLCSICKSMFCTHFMNANQFQSYSSHYRGCQSLPKNVSVKTTREFSKLYIFHMFLYGSQSVYKTMIIRYGSARTLTNSLTTLPSWALASLVTDFILIISILWIVSRCLLASFPSLDEIESFVLYVLLHLLSLCEHSFLLEQSLLAVDIHIGKFNPVTFSIIEQKECVPASYPVWFLLL